MRLTRDSAVWWVALAVAVLGYLSNVQTSPLQWTYLEWVQAASFVLAWVAGKLATSPLKKGD